MNTKTILVVDDFVSIRKFVCETLERHGFITLQAANGKEAYDLLSKADTTIDLVLSDCNMPDCTGLELLKKIKSNPATASVPVIFLTAEKKQEAITEAAKNGLFAWITKPYKTELFFHHINNAINN